MTKCIIIGGGFAGLSAACYLAGKGIKVHLLEGSPKLGGRAYSFNYQNENTVVDNGQHIMMGCYKNTIDFLKLIGAENKISFQESLKINFVERGGENHKLDSSKLFYPFNLLLAILNYTAISFRERISILKLFIKIFFTNPKKYKNISAAEWLENEKQNKRIIKSLWEIIVVGTLNTSAENASAEMLIKILKEIFFTGRKSSVIVLPETGLSEMYCEDAKKYVIKNGGEISLSEKVIELGIEEEKIKKVVTNKDVYSDYDFIISAVPFHSFQKIINESENENLQKMGIDYSPILTAHLWLSNNPFGEKFYGLIDSKIHWVFNHGKHITIVTSAANELIDLNEEEITKIIYSELENYFPIFSQSFVTEKLILKEKRATFIPTVELTERRDKLKFSFKNFFIAGDWTNTGLPSTIEGAVLSGRAAADAVIFNKINK